MQSSVSVRGFRQVVGRSGNPVLVLPRHSATVESACTIVRAQFHRKLLCRIVALRRRAAAKRSSNVASLLTRTPSTTGRRTFTTTIIVIIADIFDILCYK